MREGGAVGEQGSPEDSRPGVPAQPSISWVVI